MKGSHKIIVQNNRIQYKFSIRRNLTILRGNSATGKSTLIDLIAQYVRDGENSGVILRCDKPCTVLTSDMWRLRLSAIRDSIVFIDKGNSFVATQEFAEEAQHSDNYYVLAFRETLPQLPYSVDEIYTLKNQTKGYGQIKRLYTSFQNIYERPVPSPTIERPDFVIVEDSHAGYQFFHKIFEAQSIPCISAKGKSNICAEIEKTPVGCRLLIIADGAAFGSEIEKTLAQRRKRDIVLFLPESFEWLILKSGLIDGRRVQDILNDPAEYIDSETYFSWERYFTDLLTAQSQDTYLAYKKTSLNPNYFHEHEKQAILQTMPDIENV
jgi:hypothetical protein